MGNSAQARLDTAADATRIGLLRAIRGVKALGEGRCDAEAVAKFTGRSVVFAARALAECASYGYVTGKPYGWRHRTVVYRLTAAGEAALRADDDARANVRRSASREAAR